MKRILASLVAAVLMTACAPAPEEAPAAPEPAPVTMPAPETPPGKVAAEPLVRAGTEASCAAVGGEWKPVCRMQQPACVTTFDDGGKACTDGSQCKSTRCLAAEMGEAGIEATGTCAPNDDPCGCFTLIEDGKTLPGLCAD
jgi:hypothetical protein